MWRLPDSLNTRWLVKTANQWKGSPWLSCILQPLVFAKLQGCIMSRLDASVKLSRITSSLLNIGSAKLTLDKTTMRQTVGLAFLLSYSSCRSSKSSRVYKVRSQRSSHSILSHTHTLSHSRQDAFQSFSPTAVCSQLHLHSSGSSASLEVE